MLMNQNDNPNPETDRPLQSNQSNRTSFNTNQIIVAIFQKYNKKTHITSQTYAIYVPVYLRVLVKEIQAIDYENLNAQINLKLNIAIYVGSLGDNIREELKTKIILFLSRDGALRLSEEYNQDRQIKFNQDRDYFNFSVRKVVNARICPYVFFSPFEMLDFTFSAQFRTHKLYKDSTLKTNEVQIRFQLMDNDQQDEKLNFFTGCRFGSYCLAQNSLYIQYDHTGSPQSLMQLGKNIYTIKCLDQRKEQIQLKKQQKSKQKYFQNAHIHIPLYRKPLIAFTTVFFPLFLIGAMNLAIFYQSPVLGDRISNIANLLTVFIAIVPTLREKSPPHPQITLIEYSIYLQAAAEMLCLINSLRLRNKQSSQFQKEHNPFWDPQFLASLVITGLVFLLFMSGLIYYYIGVVPKFYRNRSKRIDAQILKQKWHQPKLMSEWKQWMIKNEAKIIEEKSDKFTSLLVQFDKDLNTSYKKKQQQNQTQSRNGSDQFEYQQGNIIQQFV